MSKTAFRNKLEHLLNSESMENGSDTPDFILADYLTRCLENFDETIKQREEWYGRLRQIDGEPHSVPEGDPS